MSEIFKRKQFSENQRAFDDWAGNVLPDRHAELVANPGLGVSLEAVREHLQLKIQAALAEKRS